MWNYHRVCYRQVLSVAFWRRWTPSSECNAGLCCTERLANGSTCTQLEAERLDGFTWREITQLGGVLIFFDTNMKSTKIFWLEFNDSICARQGSCCAFSKKTSSSLRLNPATPHRNRQQHHKLRMIPMYAHKLGPKLPYYIYIYIHIHQHQDSIESPWITYLYICTYIFDIIVQFFDFSPAKKARLPSLSKSWRRKSSRKRSWGHSHCHADGAIIETGWIVWNVWNETWMKCMKLDAKRNGILKMNEHGWINFRRIWHRMCHEGTKSELK